MAAIQRLRYLIQVIANLPKLGVCLCEFGGVHDWAASGTDSSISKHTGAAKAGKAQASISGFAFYLGTFLWR